VYIINTEGQADEATLKDYQGMIGSLLYLAVYSKSNILYAVIKLSQFCINPSAILLAAVIRIFRYLRSFPNLGITYSKDVGDQLVGYTDVNWAGGNVAEDGRRSTSAYIFTLSGGPVS
jgi:hypothetical protein